MPKRKHYGRQSDKTRNALEKAFSLIQPPRQPIIETPTSHISVPKEYPKIERYTTSYGFDTGTTYLPKPIAIRITSYAEKRIIYNLLIKRTENNKVNFSLKESGHANRNRGRKIYDFKFTNLYKATWLGARGKIELDGIQETIITRINPISEHLGLDIIID